MIIINVPGNDHDDFSFSETGILGIPFFLNLPTGAPVTILHALPSMRDLQKLSR